MAAFQGISRVEDRLLTTANTETVLQLVAVTNHRVKILGWGISFNGLVVTEEPIKVILKRSSTAGTSSAGTVVKVDDSLAETLLTTARITFTGEPTVGDELETKFIHPQGWFEKIYPEGKEIIVGGADRIGLEVTTAAGITPECNAFFHFEE